MQLRLAIIATVITLAAISTTHAEELVTCPANLATLSSQKSHETLKVIAVSYSNVCHGKEYWSPIEHTSKCIDAQSTYYLIGPSFRGQLYGKFIIASTGMYRGFVAERAIFEYDPILVGKHIKWFPNGEIYDGILIAPESSMPFDTGFDGSNWKFSCDIK